MKKLIFIACIMVNTFCAAQDRCLRFCVDLMDLNGQSLNNAKIHRDRLMTVLMKFSYFNCGAVNFHYNKHIMSFTNLGINEEFTRMSEGPIFVRIYRHNGRYYAPYLEYDYDGINNASSSISSDSTDDEIRPNVETVQLGHTYFFEYLPIGKYKFYFSYMWDFNLKTIKNEKMDSIINTMCFGGRSDFDPGFFLQFAKNPISFEVIE